MPDELFEEHQLAVRTVFNDLPRFFADRLKVQQREAGVRHDLIDAVFALGGGDDLVRLIARVNALQAFVETAEGANLLAGYKRASNILKKEGWGSAPAEAGALAVGGQVAPTLRPSPDHDNAEHALVAALDIAGPTAAAALQAEDFTGAMSALASLRAPIDAFFDTVIVNDPDSAIRARRLNLLAALRDAVIRWRTFRRSKARLYSRRSSTRPVPVDVSVAAVLMPSLSRSPRDSVDQPGSSLPV